MERTLASTTSKHQFVFSLVYLTTFSVARNSTKNNESERKLSWPNLRHCPGIRLEGPT